jgi:hypothetical protein
MTIIVDDTFLKCCAPSGRSYLVKNGDLVSALLTCLQTETRDVLTRDNALGCLQKLSLRLVMFVNIKFNSAV